MINQKDRKVAEEIINLQRESYQKEAELIGTTQIPPLLETVKDIRQNNTEKIIGALKKDHLIALIAYEIDAPDTITISRLAVHPNAFRQGLAKKLFHKLEQTTDANIYLVSTGKANIPAIKFYEKMGFTIEREFTTKDHIELVSLKKSTI